MAQTILAVDIGNTRVHGAVFKGKALVCTFLIPTNFKDAGFRREFRNKIAHARKHAISCVVICSVVPEVTKTVVTIIERELKLIPQIAGQDIQVPLKSLYNKKQIGQDRLVCAYVGQMLYRAPLIIIDLGTAITCDYVGRDGAYAGGIIIPGIRLSAESLFYQTALLPNVKIARPKALIGRDTNTSILSGIFYGYGALLDGLIGRIHQQYKNKAKVILTGGYAKFMKGFMEKKVHKINEQLVLDGLRLIAQNSR